MEGYPLPTASGGRGGVGCERVSFHRWKWCILVHYYALLYRTWQHIDNL